MGSWNIIATLRPADAAAHIFWLRASRFSPSSRTRRTLSSPEGSAGSWLHGEREHGLALAGFAYEAVGLALGYLQMLYVEHGLDALEGAVGDLQVVYLK